MELDLSRTSRLALPKTSTIGSNVAVAGTPIWRRVGLARGDDGESIQELVRGGLSAVDRSVFVVHQRDAGQHLAGPSWTTLAVDSHLDDAVVQGNEPAERAPVVSRARYLYLRHRVLLAAS